jgi:hypothetical protein
VSLEAIRSNPQVIGSWGLKVMGEKKTGTWARLASETKTMILVFVYLALFFGAFTTYRSLVLAEYRIGHFHYGFSLFEALVLAKLIVFGSILGLGGRFSHYPLIVPTLYRTACFSVFVLAFSILEHLGDGWWNGDNSSAVLGEIFSHRQWEILARVLVMVTAFVPLFAVWETGRLMGEGKLFELFFKRRTAVKLDTTFE